MNPIRVTYVQPDGSQITCELDAGDSVMDGALDHGIPGILGQCGGGCTCATCHCYVREPHRRRVAAPTQDEIEILTYVRERRPESRLACQIRIDDSLDGLIVEVPARQP
jgi:2Fe-2S ferredoxin